MVSAMTVCMTEHVQPHPCQRMMRTDDPDLCGKRLDVGSVSCVPWTRSIMIYSWVWSGGVSAMYGSYA